MLCSDFDRQIMQRCLQLARQALGQTAPNPLVGAVVVQDGQIIGEGFHPGAGHPHAEVFALRDAGDRARGATVYVNLEPCNHYGRTPPCSEALIKAGVAKVVIGMVDPDPRVSGGGIQRLRAAGIKVVTGVEEPACQDLNEAFVYRVTHQCPFGILKYAMTLDGKIAATGGHSAWVTSPLARAEVHSLRAACDAVVVGGNTVRRDNPLLTTHNVGKREPLRVVMSRTLELPDDAQLWDTNIAPTVIFTEQGRHPQFQEHLRKTGVEVIEVSTLTPVPVMQNLYERGCLTVLWECGGTLAARAIATGVIQKIYAFIAPKIIGGVEAPSPIGELGYTHMTEALNLDRVRCQWMGPDLLLTGYLGIQIK
jgi:diaminohydroxyphosphoribosylaminopyrimidine deaminase/5-amino-6-(5-phosphoribosylamino)uracil reductase